MIRRSVPVSIRRRGCAEEAIARRHVGLDERVVGWQDTVLRAKHGVAGCCWVLGASREWQHLRAYEAGANVLRWRPPGVRIGWNVAQRQALVTIGGVATTGIPLPRNLAPSRWEPAIDLAVGRVRNVI